VRGESCTFISLIIHGKKKEVELSFVQLKPVGRDEDAGENWVEKLTCIDSIWKRSI